MLKLILLPLFFVGFSFGYAAESPTLRYPESSLVQTSFAVSENDEVKIIDQLIFSTQKQLEDEKKLRELMLQFKDQIEEFVQGKQTKTHASQMVRTARQIYEMISANHIEHLFPKDYLDELTFFSSIAGKNGISKP